MAGLWAMSCGLWTVRAATITNLMVDSARVGLQTNAVKFVPLDTPLQVSDGTMAVDVPVSCRTDTNGALSVNLVGGRYRVEFGNGARGFKILVPPEETNTYSLTYCASLMTNVGTFVYTGVPSSMDTNTVRAIAAEEAAKATNALSTAAVVTFGSTNDPPTSTAAPVRWVRAQVAGDEGQYWVPLYQ